MLFDSIERLSRVVGFMCVASDNIKQSQMIVKYEEAALIAFIPGSFPLEMLHEPM